VEYPCASTRHAIELSTVGDDHSSPWGEMDMGSNEEVLARSRGGVPVRSKVGAEQLQQVPSLVYRPDTVFRAARIAPVGPTHAVGAATGAVACGIKADRLQVLNQDSETACLSRSAPAALPPSSPRASRRGTRQRTCSRRPSAVVEHRVPPGPGVPSTVDGGMVQPASGSGSTGAGQVVSGLAGVNRHVDPAASRRRR
jgi:hypothetical protein